MVYSSQADFQKVMVYATFIIAIYLSNLGIAAAASNDASIQALDIARLNAPAQIKSSIAALHQGAEAAIEQTSGNKSQETVLIKTGEVQEKLVSLHGTGALTLQEKKEQKDLFLANRDVIKIIYQHNRNILSGLQDKFGKVADPLKVFKSPQWKEPQVLAATAGYRLGWNNYYTSLLTVEDDPMRKSMLDEAIEGFGFAFLNAGKDTVIVKSLFGRALCWRQIQRYTEALKDFTAVRQALKKDDPLIIRCLYEESLTNSMAGNADEALRNLEKLEKAAAGKKIPDEVSIDVKRLIVVNTIAVMEKRLDGATGAQLKESVEESLDRLMALKNPAMAKGIYTFALNHADQLEDLPCSRLGSAAAMAIADRYFDRGSYDHALDLYRKIISNPDPFAGEFMDGARFRAAYISCKREAWPDALPLLEGFNKQFPNSPFLKDASALYYLATANIYKKVPYEDTQRQFIDAVRVYLQYCPDGADRSEAHFHLGNYLEENGKHVEAMSHFVRVKKDSSNFGAARYYMLQDAAARLDALERGADEKSKAADKLRSESAALFAEVQREWKDGTENAKSMASALTALQAKLNYHNARDSSRKALENLDGFETRFPEATLLFMDITMLRVRCYVKLAMMKEAETEIDRSRAAAPVLPVCDDMLREFAAGLYDEAKCRLEKREEDLPKRYIGTALMIYQKIREKQTGGDASAKSKIIEASIAVLEARLATFEGEGDCEKILKKLDGFESHFPEAGVFFPEVITLRILYQVRLSRTAEAEAEVDRCVKEAGTDPARYAALQELANRFCDEAKLRQSKGEKESAGRYAASALMVCKKLYALSEKTAAYKKYIPAIQVTMAGLYRMRGEDKQALALYEDVLRKVPDAPDILCEIGPLYEKAGLWEKALNTWKRYSEAEQSGTAKWLEARYRTSCALNKLGRKETACTLVKVTLTLHPEGGGDQWGKKWSDLKTEVCGSR